MDFALDAPGLLENLLVCTTRGSSLVRSAAAEELQRAAAEDEVATIAWRVLEILERGGEESGRVKALEWINTCVSERYQDVVDAAAEIGASRAVSSAESSGLLPNGFETAANDFSLARDSVDLEAGYDAADAETPNVAVLLSREGVAGAATCLDDAASARTRLAAIHVLASAWETLAADERKRAEANPGRGGRLVIFQDAGALWRVERCVAEETDPETRRAADALKQRIENDELGAADAFDEIERERVGAAVADELAAFLRDAKARAARESARESEREEREAFEKLSGGLSTPGSGSTGRKNKNARGRGGEKRGARRSPGRSGGSSPGAATPTSTAAPPDTYRSGDTYAAAPRARPRPRARRSRRRAGPETSREFKRTRKRTRRRARRGPGGARTTPTGRTRTGGRAGTSPQRVAGRARGRTPPCGGTRTSGRRRRRRCGTCAARRRRTREGASGMNPRRRRTLEEAPRRTDEAGGRVSW